MQEPKIHSAIVPFLPPDHWLFAVWEDPEIADPDILSCDDCGWPIYSKANGTMRTWIETGRVVDEHGDGEHLDVAVFCFHCAAHMDYMFPIMREWFALTDDGGYVLQEAGISGA